MPTTVDYIDQLRNLTETRSDYAVAKYLGISEDAVNQYRKGTRAMSPDIALLIAEKLQLPILEVLADAMAEHAKTPEMKRKWLKVRKLWAQVARIALIAVCATPWRPTLPHGENRMEALTLSSASEVMRHATPNLSRDGYPSSDGNNNYATFGRRVWRTLRQWLRDREFYPTPSALRP